MCRFPGAILIMMLLTVSTLAHASTTIRGRELALKSSGHADGEGWVLNRNGYVGTYIRLEAPCKVTIALEASGQRDSEAPQVRIVVADEASDVDVASDTLSTQSHAFDLPGGTWFVRVELVEAPPDAQRGVTIRKLTIEGAQVANEHSDANAIAAANSYIEHFRKGRAEVRLPGVAPGTGVLLKLRRHAFNFGTAVAGFENNELLIKDPPAGSDPARYQDVIRKHFNAIVPGNAGKWVYNEKERNIVTMDFIDQILEFARENNMRARMHTMLWDTGQQPEWVNDLLTKAAAGDESAKKELRAAISHRIRYYVRDRAGGYEELDVLNESLHKPRYLDVFGIEGLADIHAETGRAVEEAGANTRLFVNEYNVFQWSQLPPPFGDKETWDPYANWLREHAEELRAAGGRVDGIGIQYYVNPDPKLAQPHSPARIFSALQNLSVGGWPITLTEFGASTGADESLTTEALEHTVRLIFGTSNANGFMMWGIWETEMWERALGAAFYDKQWNPRQPQRRWEAMMSEWDTNLGLKTDENGAIRFTGFYGDYEIVVGDRVFPLTLEKGHTQYSIEADR